MTKLFGLCVSKGNVNGTALIVKNANMRPENVAPNTILVMEVLDRELLINLDKNIVGVIAEYGNIGSHGSGILRQLRIPCILRIKSATSLFKNGEYLELRGDENCVIYNPQTVEGEGSSILKNNLGLRYKQISRRPFTASDIRIQDDWISLRPKRRYQKLRFEMLRETHIHGPNLLFGLPLTQLKQDENGIMLELGAPKIDDICSFILANPDWLTEKCEERKQDINFIYLQLEKLLPEIENADFNAVVNVFKTGIQLYRILFKYMYMSQATSEEMLDIYLDFVGDLYGKKISVDLLGLNSDYVKRSIESGIYPGISQRWSKEKSIPYIWKGNIDYSPFPIDKKIKEAISLKKKDESRYLADYESFRIIIPLIYQLSEEYYYVSSSIHSFVSWSLVKISEYAQSTKPGIKVEDLYDKSLNEVWEIIDCINQSK